MVEMKIMLFCFLLAISGCLTKGNVEDNVESEILADSFHLEDITGEYQTRVDFTLPHDNITEITFRFTVSDDDPETNPDIVDSIEVAEHDNDGDVFINYYYITESGPTPYDVAFTIKYSNVTLIDNEWQVYFRVNMVDGDDTWPGPFIFRGTRDTGYQYSIEISYSYYLINPYNNNI